MTTLFVAFIVSLVVGAVLTLLVRNRAIAMGWVQRVKSSRNVHVRPVPRLGGVAIVGGFFAPLVGLLMVDSTVGELFSKETDLVFALFLGGSVIALLGLYDDFRGAGARKKFAVQFAVATLLYVLGFRIDSIANPFGDPFALGWFGPLVTVLWVVGIINAVNLIDGLDGLAGGVAFFAVITNWVLALTRGDVLLSLMMAALAGAIIGFLIFNFNPASIFMGDTGSMFLGFVLAAVSIKTSSKSGTVVTMVVPVIALGLPIMDTLLAMFRRAMLGRSMFSADKDHIHHRLMHHLGLTHRHAVLFLYGVSCLFAVVALGLAYANSAETAMLLSVMGLMVVVLMRKLGYLNLKSTQKVVATRTRNLQLRSLVKATQQAIDRARSMTAIWEAMRPLAGELGADRLELRVMKASFDGERDGVVYETRRDAGTAPQVEVQVPLGERQADTGRLVVSWRDGRTEIDRDEELALEMIADTAANKVERLTLEKEAGPQKVISLRK